MRKVIVIAFLAAVAVGVLWWSQQRTGPLVVSGFIEANEIRLGSRVGGRVLEVKAVEGQPVKRGDVLVTLEPYDLRERLAEAQAGLAAKKEALKKLHAGYRVEEIEQARARRDRFKAVYEKRKAGLRPLEIQIKEDKLAAAQAMLDWAESDHQRVQALFEQSQASQEELDESVRRLNTAQAEFAVARDELALAREGTRSEEIAEAQANLAEAEAQVKLLEAGYRSEEIGEAEAAVRAAEADVATIERQIRELQIVAPADSVVEAVDLQPGDLVGANAPVLTLLDMSELWVRAYVPENRLGLAVGQKLRLRVDAFPQRDFTGEVTFIARQAEFTPSNVQTPEERVKQMFRIKVAIEGGRDVLRPGMSTDVYLEPAR
jgi:HlyD family secretion protein